MRCKAATSLKSLINEILAALSDRSLSSSGLDISITARYNRNYGPTQECGRAVTPSHSFAVYRLGFGMYVQFISLFRVNPTPHGRGIIARVEKIWEHAYDSSRVAALKTMHLYSGIMSL